MLPIASPVSALSVSSGKLSAHPSEDEAREFAYDEPPLKLLSSNPPLRIMAAGRKKRVKGARKTHTRGPQSRAAKMVESSEFKGLVLVLLSVALFVALEVIVVDSLFLSPTGRIANMELHINTSNVFVSHLVEAGLNRYRLPLGIESQRLKQHGHDKPFFEEDKTRSVHI